MVTTPAVVLSPLSPVVRPVQVRVRRGCSQFSPSSVTREGAANGQVAEGDRVLDVTDDAGVDAIVIEAEVAAARCLWR